MAETTDAARMDPRDMTALIRHHTAPLSHKPRTELVAHLARIDSVAPAHDLISGVVNSNLPAAACSLQRNLPVESSLTHLSRLRVR